jgi:hypothetical protein
MRTSRWVLVLALLAGEASAWEGHEVITRAAIASLSWLDQYSSLEVTPHTDAFPLLNQTYTFAFKGEKPGDRLSAREVLARYPSEPDWGCDQDLNVSPQQAYMGGYTGKASRGYFHMFYPPEAAVVPVPNVEMGAAPDRLALFYGAAQRAFERRDPYWGFRYLSCALHYIQDLGQPYHATQLSKEFFVPGEPVTHTAKKTANYHFVYEFWVEERLKEEDAGQSGFGLLAAVGGVRRAQYASLPNYVKRVAVLSHQQAPALVPACVDFFDRKFMQPVDVPFTAADLAQLEPAEPRARMLAATVPALKITGESIRGFLDYARAMIEASGTPASPIRHRRVAAPAAGRLLGVTPSR